MLQSIPEQGGSAMTAPFRAFVVDQTADEFKRLGLSVVFARKDTMYQITTEEVDEEEALQACSATKALLVPKKHARRDAPGFLLSRTPFP